MTRLVLIAAVGHLAATPILSAEDIWFHGACSSSYRSGSLLAYAVACFDSYYYLVTLAI
jgi:hypothetical protein